MDDDIDRICAEFHEAHDPVAQTRTVMRILAAHCIATFSNPAIYDRAGWERAREEWDAAMPPVLKQRSLAEQLGARPVTGPMLTRPRTDMATDPVPDATFVQIREPRHLPEGRELLDIVQAMATLHPDDSLTEQVNRAAAWVVETARRRGNSQPSLESAQRRIWRWIDAYRSELHPEFTMLPSSY
jgi:hypothetical protein